MATAGLRALVNVQASRQLSQHSFATSGLAISLRDGSINLSMPGLRQMSETTVGSIKLVLGVESSISVGWQKKDEKTSAAGDLKLYIAGRPFEMKVRVTMFFIVNNAQIWYDKHWCVSTLHSPFSPRSHGRIAGGRMEVNWRINFCSTALEIEVGGGRKISEFSTVRMLYTVGFQVVLLFRELNAILATSAFFIPSSLYFLLKVLIVSANGDFLLHSESSSVCVTIESLSSGIDHSPYHLKRERRKAFDKMANSSIQVNEARKAAEKAQKILEIVSNRKRNKQLEKGGLVITKAVYGNMKEMERSERREELNDEVTSQVLDVTLPLNFLVADSGQLKLHEGIKKSGIMGFVIPALNCPNNYLWSILSMVTITGLLLVIMRNC
ncbi:hypothetical protein HPP92_015035 [Vanilla planifolia]|uniref:DnaJ-like protein C11 C-terminal domain-containing protein n=1 Tax=Vanilla planifolia TaxID=51239 RepID=A0A835QRA3_VANPL|nr:hypothetical protein HPP92_015035 [Vanilla planifolia]